MSNILILLILQIFFSISLSQKCKENTNFCKKCDLSNTFCYSCEYDNLTPDENGGCIGNQKCSAGKNYCDECNKSNNLCKECEDGYFPDGNGGCSYINNCEISYKGNCLKCNSNYILIGETNNFKICKSIYSSDLKNCKSIDKSNGFCELCEEGYFLTKGDKKCVDIENCYESFYGNCLTCNNGYYLNIKEKKCLLQEKQFYHCKETIDGKNCDKCDNNYFFDEEGKCVSTNFCSKSENHKCVKCISNYYLTEDGEGCSTEENCYSSDKELGFCTWCKFNYFLKSSEKKCILDENSENKFCKIFTNKCISCEPGYYLGEDNKCSITKNCAETIEGICIQCSEGYYLGDDKKCTNYKHCIYSNFHYDCIECKDDYYWNQFNKTCEKWEKEKYFGCKLLDINGITCNICKDNYYLNETDNKCYDNNEKNEYYKCSLVTNNKCMRCLPNYYLGKDYKCSKIFNCEKSLDENNCEKCEDNYCLNINKQTCEYNKEIYEEENKKFYSCAKTNKKGNACEECEEGLILNEEGLCINEDVCSEKEGDKCIECENKKNPWKSSCLNNIFGCVDNNDENCYRCDNIFDFNNCTECYEGFQLNEERKCELKN